MVTALVGGRKRGRREQLENRTILAGASGGTGWPRSRIRTDNTASSTLGSSRGPHPRQPGIGTPPGPCMPGHSKFQWRRAKGLISSLPVRRVPAPPRRLCGARRPPPERRGPISPASLGEVVHSTALRGVHLRAGIARRGPCHCTVTPRVPRLRPEDSCPARASPSPARSR